MFNVDQNIAANAEISTYFKYSNKNTWGKVFPRVLILLLLSVPIKLQTNILNHCKC